MKFHVNIYIHRYNDPLYIIKNHDHPDKNLQLSYHDGVKYFLSCLSFKNYLLGTLQ